MGRGRRARCAAWAGVGLLAAGVGLLAAGCGPARALGAPPTTPAPTTIPVTATPPATTVPTVRAEASTTAAAVTVAPTDRRDPTTTTTTTTGATALTAAPGDPVTSPPDATGVLSRRIVTVDPGHNGGNFADPTYIDKPVFNGRTTEDCDTTGTETDAGYTEARFNWDVARYLAADLRAEGATVVLTRSSDTGVGPCVTRRAAIANLAHADVAVSIHADGGPPGGRGFTILEPVADGPNDAIVAPSRVLGVDLRRAFADGTGEPVSDYYGVDGIEPRDDLAGTNLSTVPKVFVECANMRNAVDARLVTSPAWQARAARAIAAGLTAFLTRR